MLFSVACYTPIQPFSVIIPPLHERTRLLYRKTSYSNPYDHSNAPVPVARQETCWRSCKICGVFEALTMKMANHSLLRNRTEHAEL